MKKLTKTQISEIISLYKKGISPKIIGEQFGIYNNSVTRILKKNGIARNQLEKTSDKDIQHIIDSYDKGISSTIIAKELNIDDSTVFRILKRNDINIKPVFKKDNPIPVIKNYIPIKKYDLPEKYNTTYIPTYNGMQLTVENIKKSSIEEKEKIAQFVLEYFRNGGFPYPLSTDDELIREFSLLKNFNVNSIMRDNNVLRIDNQIGSKIYKHFSPHFFEVKPGGKNRPSMLETFESDELLMRVINNRLMYDFHINGNMLRQGIANSKVAFKASVFNTGLAKCIYMKYAKPDDIIYDYSIGFGQRITAALSLPFKIKYVGVDVMQKSVDAAQNIFNFLNKNIPSLDKEVEVICTGSENYCDPNMIGKVSLAFTSPPYFSLERYSDDSKQAAFKGDYNYFINDWWQKTVNNIEKLLKDDGLFILNINDNVNGFNIGEDMCNLIRKAGFELFETHQIQLSKNLNFTPKRGGHKFEPIYVFKRVAK